MSDASHATSSSERSKKTGTALSNWARVFSISNLCQVGVHELDGNGALADARGYSFDRPMPNVAYRKHTGNAGLQQERIALQRPAIGRFSLAHHIGPGQNEAVFISCQIAV